MLTKLEEAVKEIKGEAKNEIVYDGTQSVHKECIQMHNDYLEKIDKLIEQM